MFLYVYIHSLFYFEYLNWNKSSSLHFLFLFLFQLFGNELLLNVFILASWRSKKVMRLLFIIEVFIN